MKIRAFITHKLREHYSECQDRFCINSDNHAIAVSDGMSQSVFPTIGQKFYLLSMQKMDIAPMKTEKNYAMIG